MFGGQELAQATPGDIRASGPKEGVDRDKPSQKLQGTLTYAWSTIQLLQGHPELSSKDWERNLFHSDVCTCPGSCSDGPRLGLQGVDALPPVG